MFWMTMKSHQVRRKVDEVRKKYWKIRWYIIYDTVKSLLSCPTFLSFHVLYWFNSLCLHMFMMSSSISSFLRLFFFEWVLEASMQDCWHIIIVKVVKKFADVWLCLFCSRKRLKKSCKNEGHVSHQNFVIVLVEALKISLINGSKSNRKVSCDETFQNSKRLYRGLWF